ncbi:hypothetical protein VQ03_29215 [Methylobacterium tarhaniae]|uniref:HEAT repeat domain-containing protein n=1 Tax=Methylobacterium tarhaniae TaxID=1187852 RepID=A0A0J6S893_9HYPH|nr:hypothetical protein [Methylobacterium tarhaniae]KMO29593.1 hypothetical protein VQ03_29215 [Methylobacterium tarhaniae]
MRLESTGDAFADAKIGAGRIAPDSLPVLVAGATVLCECGLAIALLRGTLAPASVILAHLAVSTVIGASAVAIHRRTASSLLIHLALWTFTAGPFGAVLAASLILGGAGRGQAADRGFGDWLDEEIEAHELGPVGGLRDDLLDGRLRSTRGHAVRPLREALDGSDRSAKFEALARVGRAFDPALCPVIHAALRDRDPSVRVLASTVLAKLQTAHGREIASRQEAVAHAPKDAAAWVALARAQLALARSGLVKPLQARANLRAGLEAAERAAVLGHGPDLTAARTLLHDLRTALDAAAPPADSAPSDPGPGGLAP